GEAGVHVTGSGTLARVFGNLIGTNVTGTWPLGNGTSASFRGTGVLIDQAADAMVGDTGAGNVISGNQTGIKIDGPGSSAELFANFIGTDITGTRGIGNGDVGGVYVVDEASATIGDLVNENGQANVISGNAGQGITFVQASGRVHGNFIGTDLTGEHPLGNFEDGIDVQSVPVGD